MPTRSIPWPFLYKQAFKTAARLEILHKFCEPQCRLSVSPLLCSTHPLRTPRWWKRATFCTGSLLIWPFQRPIRVLLFVAGAIGVAAGSGSKASVETECLHSFNQRNAGRAAGWLAGWLAEGASGEKSPCHFLCPTQERFGQQELACFTRL